MNTYSKAGVVRGTTGNEDNASATTNSGNVSLETTKCNLVILEVDTTTHGVNHRFWLFIDFLLHEMVKGTLHDLGQLDLQSLDRANG